MHETTAETIARVLQRGEDDRQGPCRELVRTEHYEVGTTAGQVGHGVRFHYSDGSVQDFPPHKLGAS